MIIKTKYNIGQKVWVLLWDNPIRAKITNIKIITRSERIYIYYNMEDVEDEFNCLQVIEKEVFATKEELLKSL